MSESINHDNYRAYLDARRITFLTYIIHVDSLPSVWASGILSRNEAISRGLYGSERDISIRDYQNRRERNFRERCGGNIHDYVPLYFGTRTPMAYVVCRMRGKTNIILLDLNLDLLTTSGMWFSDGNIASSYSKLYADLSHLPELDWETIKNWAGENGFTQWKRKTKKAAEVLIPRIVPQSKILRIAVCETSVKDKIARDLHIPESIIIVAPEQYHDVIL